MNGVEYETDDATFDIDDNGGQPVDLLRVGQQVTIEWDSLDDGVTRRAQSVSYDDTLEGPIGSIDLANQTLVVLGPGRHRRRGDLLRRRDLPAGPDGP